MASDFIVQFGGDTSKLAESVKQAQAQVKDFTTTTAAQSAEMAVAFAAVAAALGKVTGITKDISDKNGLVAFAQDAAIAAGVAVLGFEGLKAAVSTVKSGMDQQAALFQGAASALKSYAESQAYLAQYAPIAEVANDGLVASIGRVLIAYDQWQRSAEIYSSGLLQLEGVAIAAAGNIGKLQAAAAGAGFDNATRYLQSLTADLAEIPGMTDQGAAGIEATLGSIQNYSAEVNSALVAVIPKLAATQEQAQKLAQVFASFFSDPSHNWNALAEAMGHVSPQLQAQFEAAQRTLNVNKEQAAGYAAIIEEVRRLGEEKTRALQEDLQSYAQLGPLGTLLSAGIRGQVNQAIAFNAELDKTLSKLREQQALLGNRQMTPGQTMTAAAGIVGGMNLPSSQLDDLNARLATLKQRWADLQSMTAPFPADFDAQVRDISAAMRQVEQQIVNVKNTLAGGTPSQLTDLTDAREALSLGQDQLRDAKARAAALRQEADAAVDITAKTQAATAAAQAELQVRMQELEITKARNGLARAGSGAGDASAGLAEARANQAAINQVYAAGTQERIGAERQVLEAQRAIDTQRSQSAADAEDTTYAKALGASQERIALLKQEGSEHQISSAQEVAQLTETLNQELALEQAHFEKLKEIWGAGTDQYRDAQQKLATVTGQSAVESAKVFKEVNQQIYDNYKENFERIGSTVSSSLMGMIEGTQSFRQAGQAILRELVQDFIQARVKTVADWLAGEAAKTQATVIGNTTRTASTASAGAESAVASMASFGKQIAADANVVFANVFAYMSPALGPLAVVPAAAAAGLVMAKDVVGFDTGSWQIPSDMIAQVHQGEMIVPAAQTPWAQALMANATGAGGGDVHHHHNSFNVHVNGARDPSDVVDEIEARGAQVMKTLGRAFSTSRNRPRFT